METGFTGRFVYFAAQEQQNQVKYEWQLWKKEKSFYEIVKCIQARYQLHQP